MEAKKIIASVQFHTCDLTTGNVVWGSGKVVMYWVTIDVEEWPWSG